GGIAGVVFEAVNQDLKYARIGNSGRGQQESDFSALIFLEFLVQVDQWVLHGVSHLIDGLKKLVGNIVRMELQCANQKGNGRGRLEISKDVDQVFFEVDG